MPSVLRIGPYRFFFWSRENNEPAHIHVQRERAEAKFWLSPIVELADNWGFAAHELHRVMQLVVKHRAILMEAWNEHFGQDPGNA